MSKLIWDESKTTIDSIEKNLNAEEKFEKLEKHGQHLNQRINYLKKFT